VVRTLLEVVVPFAFFSQYFM